MVIKYNDIHARARALYLPSIEVAFWLILLNSLPSDCCRLSFHGRRMRIIYENILRKFNDLIMIINAEIRVRQCQ